MLLINGKAMLKIGNRYIPPGEEVEVPEGLGKKLKQAGLAKEAKEAKKAKQGKAGEKDGAKTNNAPNKRTSKPRSGKKSTP